MINILARANQSQLTIIDLQEKLCGVMLADEMKAVLDNISKLAQAANLLQVPTIATEQSPDKLGGTIAGIAQHIQGTQPIAKTAFAATAEPKFKAQLQRDKPQLILTGLEAHICVLQTAMALIAQGKEVFVVEDAVISRNPDNKRNALARLSHAGCVMTNTESVLFEWLGNANHEAFKPISALIK